MSAGFNRREARRYLRARVVVDANGCWLWQRGLNKGYGACRFGDIQYAHRLAFRAYVGELVDGLIIDHVCEVRSCCNPRHLQQVRKRDSNTLWRVGHEPYLHADGRPASVAELACLYRPRRRKCLVAS